LFCSNSLQVNESLHGLEYYSKNFEQDRHRVRHRLDVIRRQCHHRITLLQHPSSKCSRSSGGDDDRSGTRSGLPLAQVVRLIQQPDCIAIVLVDNSILTRSSSSSSSSQVALASIANQHPTETATSATASYTGHFIILTGTSRDAKHLKRASTTSSSIISSTAPRGNDKEENDTDSYCFVAYNPGVDETISYICPGLLECAWRAEGTDEDIICLYKTISGTIPS
jgi:Guanylylate cyclase